MPPVWSRTECSNKHHANVPQCNKVRHMARSMDHSLDENLLTGALVKYLADQPETSCGDVLIKKNLKTGPLAFKELG